MTLQYKIYGVDRIALGLYRTRSGQTYRGTEIFRGANSAAPAAAASVAEHDDDNNILYSG